MPLKSFNRLLHYFIPESSKSDEELLHKSRFVISYLLLSIISLLAYFIFYLTVGFPYGIYSTLGGIVYIPIIAFMLKYKVSLNILAHMYAIGLIGVIGTVVIGDGGIYSPAAVWFSAGIFAAFWIGNRRIGYFWSCIYILLVAVLYIFYENQTYFEDIHIVGEWDIIFNFIVLIGILSFLAIMATSSESNRISLMKKLSFSRRQLINSEKMASLGQLTAGIAHEINNPVNYISSNARALQMDIQDVKPMLQKLRRLEQDPSLPGEINEVIQWAKNDNMSLVLNEIVELTDGIQRGSEKVKEIVNSLKTFAYQSPQKMEEHDILKNLDSSINILHNKLKNKAIEVIRNYGDLPKVKASPGKLSQVFVNVIDNAIDAMSENGTLVINAIEVDDSIKISIEDNGRGMDHETLGKAMDPFYTTKEIGKGTGLGLSISYGIIKEHQGELIIKSTKDRGTRVEITLPYGV